MGQDLFAAIVENDVPAVEALLKKDKKLAKSKSKEGEPALIEAVKYGRLEVAKLLLDAGAKIDQQGKLYRMTPAAWAIQMGRTKLLELLLDRGVDANAVNAKKIGLLQLAQGSDLAIPKLLINRGAKAEPTALVTLLESAIYPLKQDAHSARERFQLFLKAGAKIDAVNPQKETALHVAVRDGAAELAKHLIDLGAKVDVAGPNDHTPLHYAAGLGKVGCLRVLLTAGADKDKKDNSGETPADLAKQAGHLYSHDVLTGGKKSVPSSAELGDAVLGNDVKEIKSMMARSASTKTTLIPIGVTEMYPLHLAAAFSSGETVKSLIDLGCDIDAKCGDYEQFPLYEAARSNNVEAIRMLAAAGADLEQVRDENKTALFGAVEFGRLDAVKVLLELGAKPTGLITRVAEKEASDGRGYFVTEPPEKRERQAAERRAIADLVKAAYD